MTDYHEVDYYKIIGVGREATVAQIRAAYRAKARASHPDVCRDPNAARAFTQLVEAYDVLSDVEKREDYDAFLDRDQTPPGTQVRFHSRLRPIIDSVARRLPEDPLPLLMQALQVIGLFLAAALLLLAAFYRDSQAKAPGFIPGMKRSGLRPARRSRARLLPSDGAHGTIII